MSRKLFNIKFIGVALLLATIIACGGGGGGGGGTSTSSGGTTGTGVNLSTTQTSITPNQTITITASVPSQSVQTVIFSANGGTLTQTSPTTATFHSGSNGVFTITATSDANPNLHGSLTITVAAVGLQLRPSSAILNVGQTTIFNATVTGAGNHAVTFSANGGVVTQTGPDTADYTAPQTPGVYTLTATSVANTSVKQTAQITVNQGTGTKATVVGTVVSATGSSVSGPVVLFFNASGTQVAQGTVTNGQFSIQVPPTAVSFSFNPSSVPSQFYTEYEYKTRFYAPNIQGCNALLPALHAGQTTQLPSAITFTSNSNPPPPPPDGCGT